MSIIPHQGSVVNDSTDEGGNYKCRIDPFLPCCTYACHRKTRITGTHPSPRKLTAVINAANAGSSSPHSVKATFRLKWKTPKNQVARESAIPLTSRIARMITIFRSMVYLRNNSRLLILIVHHFKLVSSSFSIKQNGSSAEKSPQLAEARTLQPPPQR